MYLTFQSVTQDQVPRVVTAGRVSRDSGDSRVLVSPLRLLACAFQFRSRLRFICFARLTLSY